MLFTDIVDSTPIAEELGDRGWRSLVAAHHRIVRRRLKEYGGKELDTAGDGFFASFNDPGSAVRCACAMSDDLRDLGVAMRAGIHFGECEPADGKLSGITVVVGARTMGLAGPGEVLVTSTVAELTRGAGFGLDDRGTQQLKGVDQPWQLSAVASVDGTQRPGPLAADEATTRRADASGDVAATTTRNRWLLVAAAAVAVVLVGGAAAAWFVTRDSGVVPGADSVARLSSDGSTFDLAVALQQGGLPQAVSADADHVWVTDLSAQTVTQLGIDGKDRRIVGTPAGPTDVTAVGGDAWVTYGFSSDPARRVDVIRSTGGISPATLSVPDGTTPLSSNEDAVWLTAQRSAEVVRTDTVTGATTTVQLPGDSGPVDVAAGPGLRTAWVAAGRRNAVYRVAVTSGATKVSAFSTGTATPTAIAVGPDGGVWVAAQDSDTILGLSPDGNSRLRLELGARCDAPTDLVATADRVWVTCGGSSAVVSLDPANGQVVSSAEVTGTPLGIAADGSGRVWVVVAPVA